MKPLEEQLIDNSNRIALMAAIIANGMIVVHGAREFLPAEIIAQKSLGVAMAIQDAVNKVAAQVREEL